MVARVASTSLVTNSPAVWRVQRSSSSCGVIAASPFLDIAPKATGSNRTGARIARADWTPGRLLQARRKSGFQFLIIRLMAFRSVRFSARTRRASSSKRPRVAKLSFHFTPGHSLLILLDTSLASFLKSLGSPKASGENRLRMTYVAMRYLLSALLIILFVKIHSNGSTVTRILFGNGFGSSYLSMYTVPTIGRRPSASSAYRTAFFVSLSSLNVPENGCSFVICAPLSSAGQGYLEGSFITTHALSSTFFR